MTYGRVLVFSRTNPPGRHAALSLAVAVAGATMLASLPASADTSPPPEEGTVGQTPPPPSAPPPGYGPGYPPPPGYGPGYAPPAPYYAPAPYYGGPPPGYYGGPGYYRPGYVVQGPYEYRSVGAMAGGIVGVSLGAILLLSAVVVASTDTCSFDSFGNAQCGGSNTGAEVGLTVAGIVGIAVGIPLIIYGAKRVPVGRGASAAPVTPLPKWAGMPAGKGWRWEF